MHQSAMKRMEWFIQNYIPKDQKVRILDVGSYNVNGCYKQLLQGLDCEYVGMDVSAGPNVDVVVKDPYNWTEFEDQSFDFVISGNAFEHIEFPWLTMQQIHNKLKPSGICCILTPFNLKEHKYPTDCYRYYPDGMIALAKYANLAVINCTTGGVPEGTDLHSWVTLENYDDTVLIAARLDTDEQRVKIANKHKPILSSEIRSTTIY